MLSLIAIALPQTAMESATIQSGFRLSISRHTISSKANVVSTRILVEKARSFPIFAASSGFKFFSTS